MKSRTLRRELTIMMLVASTCTLLSACAAIFYVVFDFFAVNTREDIEYVLDNTTLQFQDHIQFIEDGAVSIRHNTMLDTFFSGAGYNPSDTEVQLSYSMELFADRNMVDSQIPFVTSVYLFNQYDQCVYEHYYASTLASEEEQEEQYKELQQQFKDGTRQYECLVDDEAINLLFRIYDDDMQEMGICIAEINREAIEEVLGGITSYNQSMWAVVSAADGILAYEGDEETVTAMADLGTVWNGEETVDGKRILGCADSSGFGIYTVVAVGHGNIFSILQPTLLVFVVVLLVVLAITVFVAYTTSYRFTKPVTRMIESIRAFGKQDFDVRIEDSSIQEFHNIGVAFNEMADRIRYLILQVYEKQLIASQSQVKYLQSQVNPHFQFNILAMLSLKAKMAGNEELYEGLRAFSKLMQGKIFREKEIKIKVSEELEIVRFYLYLQKSRFQDKISYEIEVAEERINDDLIPRLMIEPLVENAVSHGLEPKCENGMIRIRLFEDEAEGRLHICVEDDGVGFDPDSLEDWETEPDMQGTAIEHTHTGLENTKRMLHILYDEDFEFKINGGKGEGTKIEIIIPIERGGGNVEHSSGR